VSARVRGAALVVLVSLASAACGTTVPLSERAVGSSPGLNPVTTMGSTATSPGSTAAGEEGADLAVAPATAGRGAAEPVASGGVLEGPTTPVTAGGVPERGPGWDATSIYVGVATQQTIGEVGRIIGNDALDYGDQAAQWRAVFAYVNKRGGLFGRKLVPVYYDNDLSQTQATNSAAACAKWTQDRRVAVALALIPGLGEGMVRCFKDNRLPAVVNSFAPVLHQEYAPYVPYVVVTQNADFDRLVDPWLDALTARNYFTGWDTSVGGPGVAPLRIGLLHQDRPAITRAYSYLASRLKARGIASEVVTVAYADAPDSNAVVKFRSSGVTHLFLDNLAGLLYPPVAESQGYRARFAISSLNLIQPFMEQNAPKQQLRGMLGVGWMPTADVAEEQDPGSNAAAKECLRMQAESGSSTRTRNEKYVVYGDCDAVRLYLESALASGGLSADRVVASLVSRAPAFQSALSFGLGAPLPNLVDRVRALGFDTACSCVRYLPGPDYRLPR
jgi:hypothetical protein